MEIKFNETRKKKAVGFLKLIFGLPKSEKLFSIVKKLNRHTKLFDNLEKNYVFKKRLKFNLKLNDWIQLQLFFLNKYEDYELAVVEEILNDGDTCIDIGANFGLYTLWCASIVGDAGRVVSFEPFEKNISALKENIELNKFKNIIVVENAVADTTSELNLFYNEMDKNLGMVSSYRTSECVLTVVKSVSIDEYVDANNIASIKFIKLDIEGGEYLALTGMRNTLEKFKPILQIEIDSSILENTTFNESDIYTFLEKVNYEMFSPVLGRNNVVVKAKYSKNYYFRFKL